jgi:hypothetical protein
VEAEQATKPAKATQPMKGEKPVKGEKRRGKSRSVRTVSGGLPSLGKRRR